MTDLKSQETNNPTPEPSAYERPTATVLGDFASLTLAKNQSHGDRGSTSA
jgi:hypothetical protein